MKIGDRVVIRGSDTLINNDGICGIDYYYKRVGLITAILSYGDYVRVRFNNPALLQSFKYAGRENLYQYTFSWGPSQIERVIET